MAESPAHRFGQVIGALLESVIRPQLEIFCDREGFFLDHQQKSRLARRGRKVTWQDQYLNMHDLDFVIEQGGTDTTLGDPVAFIEVAWRRYTKHSRNKAQEIQGAVLPLAEKYQWNNPFLGAVLAGVFTEGSLVQLRSLGFHVLYFPYETLVDAFASESIDIRFDESTPDDRFRACVEQIEAASLLVLIRIRERLVQSNQREIQSFFDVLHQRLGRKIARVLIIPLYGRSNEFVTLEAALHFLDVHQIYEGSGDFFRYEIQVEFTNGDRIQASFDSKQRVRDFFEYVARL